MKYININTFNQQGKRSYQEDDFAIGEQYLLVADGVGGSSKGKIASGIVCDKISSLLIDAPPTDNIKDWMQNAVDLVLQALMAYASEHPESYGMGSTMALLLQMKDGLYAVHIGDSPIYHFGKGGDIKWKSKDHSLVQELMDADVITPEQAATHPRRNVITRVLQAKDGAKTKASIQLLQNIKEGDTFLVCSDGVTEAWTDDGLTVLMKTDMTFEEKVDEIKKYCDEKSRDNNTAILCQIEDVPTLVESPKSTPKEKSITDVEVSKTNIKPVNHPPQNKSKKWMYLLGILLLGAVLFFMFSNDSSKGDQNPSNNEESAANYIDNSQAEKKDKKKIEKKRRNRSQSIKTIGIGQSLKIR